MDTKDLESYRNWIADYFDRMVYPKIKNLDKIIDQGFVEEALTLALCYIEAIPNFLSPSITSKHTFINTIYDYSGQKDLFSKISIWFFSIYSQDAKPIPNYNNIKTALINKFGSAYDVKQEVDKNELIKYLKSNLKRNCDIRNLEKNLDNFSYAAVLYEWGRSASVHNMGIFTTPSKGGVPLFSKNKQGDDVYYDSDRLCFSKEIIISTLKNIYINLRKKCLVEAKFPYEL